MSIWWTPRSRSKSPDGAPFRRRTQVSQRRDQPAVDDEVRAGDVSCAVAGQEQYQVRDLLRPGESPGSGGRGDLPGEIARLPAASASNCRVHPVLREPQRCLDRTGADRVNADAARTYLLG